MHSTTRDPYFSVVIPTYNRSTMLYEAIQSVLAQTFSDFEVLVVDDHSTDDTRSVVTAIHDPRIRYLCNDRQRGGSGARNTGIFHARGTWVAFLDDDDLWLPEKLQRQHARIATASEAVGLVYTGFAAVKHDGRRVVTIPQREGRVFDDLLYSNVIGGFSPVAIRRDLLVELGGLDESFPSVQDAELYIRVAQCSEVAFVKEPLVDIRIAHGDRITTNWRRKLEGSQLLLAKYRELYNQTPRRRHRAEGRVFTFAMLARDWTAARAALPWTLRGALVDPGNFLQIAKRLLAHFLRRRS